MRQTPDNELSRRNLIAGTGIVLAGLTLETELDASEQTAPPAAFPVSIEVDTNKVVGEFQPIWQFFGADEPNYATMKDGRKLLGELGALDKGNVFFRTHNLLTSGDGKPALKWGSTNAYTEDANGKPIYDWRILDSIFDAYKSNGVRPYVQIGFMPEALSVKPVPYQHHWTPTAKYEEIYTGWAYPPKDYKKWGELVYQWVRHCIQRYGKSEVEKWYWEVWNEPNIGYWRGTPEEFRKLHDYAANGVRRALPAAKVGGPDVAGGGGDFLGAFLQHSISGKNRETDKPNRKLDFISFHAKGAPTFVAKLGTKDGHVRMGIANQLRDIDRGFKQVASYADYKRTPIVIGESDPDGCAACQGPQLGYRNSTMYSSYTAATFARKYLLQDRHGVNLLGALTWAFEFEDQSLFAGFRVMATGGLDLPVLNVFRMLSLMKVGKRVAAKSSSQVDLDAIMKSGVRGDASDVGVLAVGGKDKTAMLIWHYHDNDLPGPDASVDLNVALPPTLANAKSLHLTHYRIDERNSNAFTAWKRMGSPATPTPDQFSQLEKAGKLAKINDVKSDRIGANGQATVKFKLPRQGVSLIVLEAG